MGQGGKGKGSSRLSHDGLLQSRPHSAAWAGCFWYRPGAGQAPLWMFSTGVAAGLALSPRSLLVPLRLRNSTPVTSEAWLVPF